MKLQTWQLGKHVVDTKSFQRCTLTNFTILYCNILLSSNEFLLRNPNKTHFFSKRVEVIILKILFYLLIIVLFASNRIQKVCFVGIFVIKIHHLMTFAEFVFFFLFFFG